MNAATFSVVQSDTRTGKVSTPGEEYTLPLRQPDASEVSLGFRVWLFLESSEERRRIGEERRRCGERCRAEGVNARGACKECVCVCMLMVRFRRLFLRIEVRGKGPMPKILELS